MDRHFCSVRARKRTEIKFLAICRRFASRHVGCRGIECQHHASRYTSIKNNPRIYYEITCCRPAALLLFNFIVYSPSQRFCIRFQSFVLFSIGWVRISFVAICEWDDDKAHQTGLGLTIRFTSDDSEQCAHPEMDKQKTNRFRSCLLLWVNLGHAI